MSRLADWSADAVKSALQRVGKNLGLKGRELFQPVRVAVTGRNGRRLLWATALAIILSGLSILVGSI